MTPLLIDSNIVIGLLSDDVRFAPMLDEADAVLVSPIVIGEVLAGFDGSTRRGRAQMGVFRDFLSAPNLRIVPLTEKTAEVYARVFRSLKSAGTPIPIPDVWIAAQAIEHGAALVTCDAHFNAVDGLELVSHP